MYRACLIVLGVVGTVAAPACAADSPATVREPKAVPATREEMKGALDRLKHREPRLPLPPPTEEEIQAQARQAAGGARGLGPGLVNNARMRNRYLPEELRGTPQSREPDPVMTLKAPFVTELFWIASRVNNCHYCLGHQESKLAADGLTEDQIAALDGDWSDESPDRRAAFAFTRKLTYQPHEIGDDDLQTLRGFFTDLQVLEIVFLVARYNATNRWTDSLGIPQEGHRDYLTPTAVRFQNSVSRVAPLAKGPAAAPALRADRPGLESGDVVNARWAAAANRVPRLPLVSEDAARELLPDLPPGTVPAYVRLLANFPKTGVAAIRSQQNLERHGRISPVLKAQIAWVAARQDRAWYALSHATRWLKDLGQSDQQVFALDAADASGSEGDRLALALTRKLTVTPQWITDEDIAGLRRHFSDPEVAEVVYRITQAAQFDRLTEAAGLPIEP